MKGIRRWVAIFATCISVTALFLVLVGGGMLLALESLLSVIALSPGAGVLSYPLGAGVLVVYACGIALGIAAMRWPVAAGIAMLPLGACAFLFGGPVAMVYGVVIVCAGALLLAMCWPRDKA